MILINNIIYTISTDKLDLTIQANRRIQIIQIERVLLEKTHSSTFWRRHIQPPFGEVICLMDRLSRVLFPDCSCRRGSLEDYVKM